jgi:threonine dehydratase
VAAVLGMRCVVFLPAATHAAAAIIELLEADGAEVHSVGRNYNEALAASIEFADKTGAWVFPIPEDE